MRPTLSVFVLLAAAACVGPMPPPPELRVTSPQRGMVQGEAGRIVVKGTALPGPSGDAVARVVVNGTAGRLAADGSFTAEIDVPAGAMLLETVATSVEGSSAVDARAVQIGQLRPVGTSIERAVTAAVSADAFAKLSAAAGPIIKGMDLTAKLAPLQPIANLGDSIANVQVSLTKLKLGDVKIAMAPVDGGLQFSAELSGLDVAANAHYDGIALPEGTTSVTVTADKITIGATLVVTPSGMNGFTTKLAFPTVRATNLRFQASGLAGKFLSLFQDNLESTVQRIATSSAEKAMEPLINAAFGALAGPQSLTVLGKKLDIQASPSVLQLTRAGALVTMNLAVAIAGSEGSPGFVYTPNGTPVMNVGSGVQLGLSDDLLNELLAQVHELGLLDIHLPLDVGLFDAADFKLSMPPMVSANNTDGTLRLVLGDMTATFTDQGKQVLAAAVNAQVDLAILRGNNDQEVALKFGKVHAYVNVLGDEADSDIDLSGPARNGIGIQLDSLSQFLVTVPVPAIAGVTLDNLSLRADAGYIVASGQIH